MRCLATVNKNTCMQIERKKKKSLVKTGRGQNMENPGNFNSSLVSSLREQRRSSCMHS